MVQHLNETCPRAKRSSCFPLSMTFPSFIHLESCQSKCEALLQTHIIRSACLIRCPKRWVTKTIVFPSWTDLKLLNSRCSPSGSKAELGSSTTTNLILSDVNCMKVRELNVRARNLKWASTHATICCLSLSDSSIFLQSFCSSFCNGSSGYTTVRNTTNECIAADRW